MVNVSFIIFIVVVSEGGAQSDILRGRLVKVNSISLGLVTNAGFTIGIVVDKYVSPHFLFEFGLGITAGGLVVSYYIINPLERKFNYYSGIRLLCNYLENSPVY